MNELWDMAKGLAVLSFRYSTLRGKWTDMPDSIWLCVILGCASMLVGFIATYIRDSLEMAFAIPVVWLSAVWMFASDSGSWKINTRIASAVFLTTIPVEILIASLGKGNPLIEVPIGIYMSVCILTLRGRE